MGEISNLSQKNFKARNKDTWSCLVGPDGRSSTSRATVATSEFVIGEWKDRLGALRARPFPIGGTRAWLGDGKWERLEREVVHDVVV